eukprot:8003007-Ditylum_brightwellii.AAC.1
MAMNVDESKIKCDAPTRSKKKKFTYGARCTKFEGCSEDLKGFIFETDPRNTDRFVIVQEGFARHVGASFEHGDMISEAIRTLKSPQLERPEDPGEDLDT